MTEAPDREKLIADAWERWWEADFTWEGLAKEQWVGWLIISEGDREYAVEIETGRKYGEPRQSADRPTTAGISRPASLQDYWRADTSSGLLRTDAEMGHELVSASGQPTYHAAHLPLNYSDETPTLKCGDTDGKKAAALNQLVLQRLKVPDAEARFDGGVWLSAPDLGPDKSEFGPIVYNNAIFNGNAIFDSATFTGDASFRGATFTGKAWFDRATFTGVTEFSATFAGVASFDRATFKGRIKFQLAQFHSKAYFTHIPSSNWPEKTITWHASFNGAAFKDVLDFYGSGFGRLAAFDGALIDVGIRLDPVSEIEAAQTFRRERNGALQVEKIDGQTKRDRQEQRDKQREQMLYKFELLARRAQSNLRLGEKTFSFLYDWAADYGASIVRPFIALAIVILTFAGIFIGWAFLMGVAGEGQRQIDLEHAAAQALNFALSNSFKPLSALSADAATSGTIVDALLNQNMWIGICVRLVSILQSLLSVTLAFLFGLSVRRRFQIN